MLNLNPNVLFRIYKQNHLHVLLFRPTNGYWWITLLQNEYIGISSQWTFKHAVNEPIRHSMNLSGKEDVLERFCQDFENNLQNANDADDIEELHQRIQELQLENRRLQNQVSDSFKSLSEAVSVVVRSISLKI